MDSFTRLRRATVGVDSEAGGILEPDYQTALGQSEEAAVGSDVARYQVDASPGTLEQGGPLQEELAAGLPTASPFHSERVKDEVAFLRSRPSSLDQDSLRVMKELDESALGEAGNQTRSSEPDYGKAIQGASSAPRVARVETTECATGHVQGEVSSKLPVYQESVAPTAGSGSPSGAPEGNSDRVGPSRGSDRPSREDHRELVPEDDRHSRLEALLLKVIDENQVLKQRLDQVQSQSSWHSGGTPRVFGEPVPGLNASPVSFSAAPGLSVHHVQSESVFPTVNRDAEDFRGSCINHAGVVYRPEGARQLDGGSGFDALGYGVGDGQLVALDAGLGVENRASRPPQPPALPLPAPPVRVPDQDFQGSLRQFRSSAEANRSIEAGAGYHTPRSGVQGHGTSYDRDGYPVSPGGTVIRPPPLPGVGLGGSGSVVGPAHQAFVHDQSARPGYGGCSLGGFPSRNLGPEEPAKYVDSLPKLATADLSVSAVSCGNWWAQVKQIFTGLSPGAPEWFSSVERAATRHYNQWLVADPSGRLALDPGGVVTDFDSYRFQRVESRAVSLLLAAIPQNIKEDLITNRWLTSAAVLFRILCLYQPGGSSERAHLLSQLVSPDVSKTYKDAIVSLRRWTQNLQRAREIHATLPDASLLIKGIDAATSGLLAQNPMINFRIS